MRVASSSRGGITGAVPAAWVWSVEAPAAGAGASAIRVASPSENGAGVGGAGVGAAYGVVDGDIGNAAATGAIAGGAGGLLKSDNEKARVTKNCLRHRGYAVLN